MRLGSIRDQVRYIRNSPLSYFIAMSGRLRIRDVLGRIRLNPSPSPPFRALLPVSSLRTPPRIETLFCLSPFPLHEPPVPPLPLILLLSPVNFCRRGNFDCASVLFCNAPLLPPPPQRKNPPKAMYVNHGVFRHPMGSALSKERLRRVCEEVPPGSGAVIVSGHGATRWVHGSHGPPPVWRTPTARPPPPSHGLINYNRHQTTMLSSKILTCKGTLRQVFIRIYRLDLQSVMLVFLTRLCELLPL